MEKKLPLTRVWQKWRFSAPQIPMHRDGSPHQSASWRMVKIATFAKPETVSGNPKDDTTDSKRTTKRQTKCQRFAK
jgi:hypothetical protein